MVSNEKSGEASKSLRKASELEMKGKVKEAISEIEKAIRLNPRDAGLYNRLGDLYIKRNKIKEAVDCYKKGVKAFRRDGFFRNALGLCKKILRYDPGNMEIYLTIAELLVELDEKSDALIYFFEYIEKQRAKRNTEEVLMTLEDIKGLGVRDKKTIDKVRAIYRAIGRPELFEKFTESLKVEKEKAIPEETKISELLTPSLEPQEKKVAEGRKVPEYNNEKLDNKVKEVESTIAELRKANHLDDVINALEKSIRALSDEQKNAIALLQKSLSLNLDTLQKSINEFHQGSEKNTKALGLLLNNLSKALASLSKNQATLAQGINTNLEKMGNSFNTATKDVVKEVKGLSSSHQKAIDETRDYNKSLLSISQDLKKGIQKINDSLTKFVISQQVKEKKQARYIIVIIAIIGAMCGLLLVSVLK